MARGSALLSIADIDAFAMLSAVPDLAPDVANDSATPRLMEFLARIAQRPAVKAALAISRSGKPGAAASCRASSRPGGADEAFERAASMQLALLPGLACDDAVWAHARAAFASRADVHIAKYGALDSLPAMAEQVLRSVEGEFAIAGHSMGGRVALEVFRLAPERIRGIALLDTGTQPLAAGEPGEREVAGRHELVGIAQRDGMAAMAARWVLGMVWKPRLDDRELVDAIIAMFARSSAETFTAQIRALIARPDAGPLLPRIACPALVLCGADDSWAPAARHREMAQRIAGATLTLVPECGHMCTLERPEAVTEALLAWHARL